MGFFDSLKANANTLKDKATEMAQTGAAESKRLAEIAKLKSANLSEENSIKKAYIEIGKAYYELMGAEPGEDFAAACEKITAAKAAIEANNDRIAELKVKEEDIAEEAPEVVAEVEAVVVDAPAEDVTPDDFAEEAPAEEPTAEEVPAEEPKTEE